MERALKVLLLFSLITIAVFLGCARRDNLFDPSSPLYVGSPPVLRISHNINPDQILQSISDSEFVVRPRTTVSFSVASCYDSDTHEPLQVSLRVYKDTTLISVEKNFSNDSITVTDSGMVKVVFEITDQDGLKAEQRFTFTIKQYRKPLISLFNPIVKEGNIVWVGQKKYLTFRTEIFDPDSQLESIEYIRKPDSKLDSILYIRDTSKSDKKVTNRASTYVDTVSLECYSDSAVDAYIQAVITDKSGRTDIATSIINFTNVDISKHPVIDGIPYEKFREDSCLVCFNPKVHFNNGESSEVGYYYDFGDGEKDSNGPLRCHMYNKPGVYRVTLIVSIKGGGSDTGFVSVEIKDSKTTKPIKILNLTSVIDSGPMPKKVFFKVGLSSDVNLKEIKTVDWKFGDGNTARGWLETPNLYRMPGKYTVRAIISSVHGDYDTAFDTIQVNPKYIHYDSKGSLRADDTARFWLENYNPINNKLLRWSVSDYSTVLKPKDTLKVFIKYSFFPIDVRVEESSDGSNDPYPWPFPVESFFLIVAPNQQN